MDGDIEENRTKSAEVLEKLLNEQEHKFDENLRPQLKPKAGLYVIYRKEGDHVVYLHAGRTQKGAKGLQGRIWEQHFTSGGKHARSDFVQKVIDNSKETKVTTRREAQAWIRRNCFVKWIEEEDEGLRCWAEH